MQTLSDIAKQEKLKSIEHVQRICVVSDEWTPENGMLTAANKLKRQNIIAKYKPQLDALYSK